MRKKLRGKTPRAEQPSPLALQRGDLVTEKDDRRRLVRVLRIGGPPWKCGQVELGRNTDRGGRGDWVHDDGRAVRVPPGIKLVAQCSGLVAAGQACTQLPRGSRAEFVRLDDDGDIVVRTRGVELPVFWEGAAACMLLH